MTKRQLTEDEKSLSLKSVERMEKDLKLQQLTQDILKSEIEVLPKKTELALLTKEKELETVNSHVNYYEEQIKTLKDQIVNGVESKQNQESEE